MNEKPFFPYAIQTAGSIDPPQTKQSWLAMRSCFLKKQNQQIFSPSAPTYLRRQSGFATERKYQTCATQENGSPALQLDDLGWSGEGEYVQGVDLQECFLFCLYSFAQKRKRKTPVACVSTG